MSKTTTSECKAKDPSTCPYHGAEQRMDAAAARGDFAAYEAARTELETAKKDKADWTTEELVSYQKQAERLGAEHPAGVFVTNNLGGTCFDAVPIKEEGLWLNCDPGIFATEVSATPRDGAMKLNRGDVVVRRPLKTFTVPEGYQIKGYTELGGSKKYPTDYNTVNVGGGIRRGTQGRWLADTIVLEPTL